MGIGAGWYEHEHAGYGYPFLPPGQRLDMLREGIEIMKAMWTTEAVSYHGKHYTLQGAICQPKPIQDPHVPIWVAGGGEKVTLRIAAEHASYTNFNGGLGDFEHKSAVLRDHCDDLGSDYDAIVRSANFNILCAETEAEVNEKLSWLRSHLRRHVPDQHAADRSAALYDRMSGTPEQVVENLAGWVRAGLGYAIVNFADVAYDRSSLELFAQEVIPALA